MPLKKEKTGTVTGATLKQSNRGKKGGLTNSERVTGSKIEDTPIESTAEPTPANVVEKIQQIAQTGSNIINGVAATTQAVGNLASKVAGTIQGSEADQNPANITDGRIDTSAIMAGASGEIDEAIPRMESSEAIQKNIVINQQRNFVSVAIANTKLRQDVASLDLEQKRLLGLLIDGKTEQVHNEKRAVSFHRAVVSRDTEISHLENDRELLVQTRIRTEGTQQQTELIREQEHLKVVKLRESNEKFKLEIESTQYEKEKLKQEVTAKFLAGF